MTYGRIPPNGSNFKPLLSKVMINNEGQKRFRNEHNYLIDLPRCFKLKQAPDNANWNGIVRLIKVSMRSKLEISVCLLPNLKVVLKYLSFLSYTLYWSN